MMINEMLGIKYPIFQGAMANIATAEFAAAVSNAGALAFLAQVPCMQKKSEMPSILSNHLQTSLLASMSCKTDERP